LSVLSLIPRLKGLIDAASNFRHKIFQKQCIRLHKKANQLSAAGVRGLHLLVTNDFVQVPSLTAATVSKGSMAV